MVISDVQYVTAAWLTGALRRSGALPTGCVRDIAVETDKSIWSRIVKLRPRYDGAAGAPPGALLLKICAGDHAVFGPSEVHYYVRDYADLPDAPIPRCYDAQFSNASGAYHILMDDLSATHGNTWTRSPTLQRGLAVAAGLAALHAHWWGVERLRTHGSDVPGQSAIDRYIGHIAPGLAPLIAALGDALEPTWHEALLDIFAHHPARMIERTTDPSGFTLVHGDVNPGNILAPLDGPGPVYLLDRQPFDWSLTTWLAVSDVAYMMVHWWDSAVRRQWELPILQHYHAELLRRGVSGYSWEQLRRDYALTAVQSVYVAVEWCVIEADRTKMRWLWEPQLRKALTAFFDLRCADLW